MKQPQELDGGLAPPLQRQGRGCSPDNRASFGVVKTLWPPEPGTIKLRRRFGPGLLCVRYRQDRWGLERITTVELVVEQAPVNSRRAKEQMFGVRIGYHEKALRLRLRRLGARWDAARRLWRTRGAVVHELQLVDRVHEKFLAWISTHHH